MLTTSFIYMLVLKNSKCTYKIKACRCRLEHLLFFLTFPGDPWPKKHIIRLGVPRPNTYQFEGSKLEKGQRSHHHLLSEQGPIVASSNKLIWNTAVPNERQIHVFDIEFHGTVCLLLVVEKCQKAGSWCLFSYPGIHPCNARTPHTYIHTNTYGQVYR